MGHKNKEKLVHERDSTLKSTAKVNQYFMNASYQLKYSGFAVFSLNVNSSPIDAHRKTAYLSNLNLAVFRRALHLVTKITTL